MSAVVTDRKKGTIQSNPQTYKELALVQVLAAAIGVFDFFAEDQGHFEEEEVPVTTLPDQSLGIPHLEGLLKYQFSLGVNIPIKP